MKRARPESVLSGPVLAMIYATLAARPEGALSATVSVDASTRYQTILGWGASSWSPPWVTPALRDEVIREAVEDLGLNRLRFEGPGGNRARERRWEWRNDNGDPEDTDLSAFALPAFDRRVGEVLLPFKRLVEARGEPFTVCGPDPTPDGLGCGSFPPC